MGIHGDHPPVGRLGKFDAMKAQRWGRPESLAASRRYNSMAQKNGIVRIALIGPESTAKSTLSEALAKHYNTVWVPEYARTYLNGINRKYTLEDIVKIKKQPFHDIFLLVPKEFPKDYFFKLLKDLNYKNVLIKEKQILIKI
jgi:hypothetical protein